MRMTEHKYLLAFTLAALNDCLDLLGALTQPFESIFDIFLAIVISVLLRRVDIWSFAITVLDAIPGMDFMPIWTLYVAYRYLEAKERILKFNHSKVPVPVE